MTSPSKEAIADAHLVLGDCRRETLYAFMSDVKESSILKGLLARLNDLEDAIEAISDTLEKPHSTGEIKCVRRATWPSGSSS